MNGLALTSTTCAILAILAGATLPAQAVTLSSLTANPNNTFTDLVGNVYDQFSFLPTQSGPNNTPITADKVDIGSDPVSLGGNGIVITGGFTAQPGQTNDYKLSYRLRTPDSNIGISSFTLTSSANTIGAGVVTVKDSFLGSNNVSIGAAAITFQSGTPTSASNTVNFNPASSSVFVQKDINLSVLSSIGFASISIIDQFSQTGTVPSVPVPEPSEIVGTLVLGALGVASYLRSLQLKKQNR